MDPVSKRRHVGTGRAIALASLLLIGAAPAPDETARNRRVVTDFADIFYRQKDVRRAFEKYVVPAYIQHNPGIADGRDAAVAALADKFASPTASFEVKRILVDGDLAMIHLHARPRPDARGAAVADIYRLEKGRIVEHWDVLQPIPETSANAHPMF